MKWYGLLEQTIPLTCWILCPISIVVPCRKFFTHLSTVQCITWICNLSFEWYLIRFNYLNRQKHFFEWTKSPSDICILVPCKFCHISKQCAKQSKSYWRSQYFFIPCPKLQRIRDYNDLKRLWAAILLARLLTKFTEPPHTTLHIKDLFGFEVSQVMNIFLTSLSVNRILLLTSRHKLFKVKNGDIKTMCEFSKLKTVVVLVSLLLTLSRFHILFWCFHWWIWTINVGWVYSN